MLPPSYKMLMEQDETGRAAMAVVQNAQMTQALGIIEAWAADREKGRRSTKKFGIEKPLLM